TAAAAKTPERLKVTEARIYLIEVGGRRPVLAHILTDKGITGIGEAAVAYGTGATAAAGMIKDLAQEFLLGKDPFANRSHLERDVRPQLLGQGWRLDRIRRHQRDRAGALGHQGKAFGARESVSSPDEALHSSAVDCRRGECA